MMSKLLYSLEVILMLACTSIMFISCSGDDVPYCCKDIKKARVSATLYVNEAFAEAFDVYAETEQGEKISLSTRPSMVNIDGVEMSMYSLTIERIGKQLPLSTAGIVGYKIKDLDHSPNCYDFILTAECHGEIAYKDGTEDNIFSQWHHGPHNGGWQNVCKNDPHQDLDSYYDYLLWYFSELDGYIGHNGYYFTTSNRHWCGTTSSSAHH